MADFTFMDLGAFKVRTIMPDTEIDEIQASRSGWIQQQLVDGSAYIMARLSKRYAIFHTPYPVAILRWLVSLVTVRVYLARGVNVDDKQFQLIKEDADRAVAEIKEAADSNEGLFDLPLRQDIDMTGVARGGPYVYAEASPWDWTDVQIAAVYR